MKDVQSEQFIVVDKNDKIVGYKSRYECHHNTSLIHRAVDVVLYNKEGKIIMQKRSKQKDLFPSYYCATATGHVSKGESYEQAAYRELSEEMGVQGVSLKQKDTFIVYDEKETEMVAIFTGVYDGEFHFAMDEVESIHTFSTDEIKHISPITPSSTVCFKKLRIL
jgi:isopentenyl-diphosphate delta-isomerase type 1